MVPGQGWRFQSVAPLTKAAHKEKPHRKTLKLQEKEELSQPPSVPATRLSPPATIWQLTVAESHSCKHRKVNGPDRGNSKWKRPELRMRLTHTQRSEIHTMDKDKNFHSNFIHNSPKLETDQKSINRKMYRHIILQWNNINAMSTTFIFPVLQNHPVICLCFTHLIHFFSSVSNWFSFATERSNICFLYYMTYHLASSSFSCCLKCILFLKIVLWELSESLIWGELIAFRLLKQLISWSFFS